MDIPQKPFIEEKVAKDYKLFRNYYKILNNDSRQGTLRYSCRISINPECIVDMDEMDIVNFANMAQGEAKMRLKEYIVLKKYGRGVGRS
jgi:hypothetical protein